jgi:hypothetical protein
LQPGRTALRGLDKVEDLEGGFGLVLGPSEVRFDPNERALPHLLNGPIDLARARIALGACRIGYASLITLMICTGAAFARRVSLPVSGPSHPVTGSAKQMCRNRIPAQARVTAGTPAPGPSERPRSTPATAPRRQVPGRRPADGAAAVERRPHRQVEPGHVKPFAGRDPCPARHHHHVSQR